MLKINKDQHKNILGFAVIGYSLQFIIYIWTNLQLLWNSIFLNMEIGYIIDFIASIFNVNLVFFVVTFISGLAILKFQEYKYVSLAFVFFCIALFPLGTILSFYILYYLFVINYEEEIRADISN